MGSIQDDSNINFIVDTASIVKLNHDDYEGKSLTLVFTDSTNHRLKLRMDIGVHANLKIHQETLFFDVCITNQRVQLLCNSIEQMLVEKTTSFIKRGILSTRIKDIFDAYFLISHENPDINSVIFNINQITIEKGLHLSLKEYVNDLLDVYNDPTILAKMESGSNWTDVGCPEIIGVLTTFFNNILK